jgi:hypothetical protein
MDYNQAVDGAQAAFDQEMQSRDRMNQQMVQQKKAQALAGRYTGEGGGGDDDDCKRRWKNAADYCSQLDDLPRNSPEFKKVKNIFGRDILDCMRGQVDQRCGGNKIPW